MLKVLVLYLEDLLLLGGGGCFAWAAWALYGWPAAAAVAGGWLCLLSFLVARAKRGGGA